MFAVPGWNIPAKRLVQEQSAISGKERSKSSSKSTPDPSGIGNQDNNSKKRKHELDNHSAGAKQRKVQDGSQPSDYTRQGTGRGNNKLSHNHVQEPESSVLDQQRSDSQGSSNIAAVSNKKHQKRSPESTQTRTSGTDPAVTGAKSTLQSIPPAPEKLTPLQAQMRAKLTSARFRHLNETLYTTSSADALALFGQSPDLFKEYHDGFAQQVKDSWPRNPVETYVKHIKFRGGLTSPVNNIAPLPRRRPGTCHIVDLGCGDAPLARCLEKVTKKLDLKLSNFDLHSSNPHVIVADISALPLHDGEADLAIFCLSLMGTNWLTFVEEAWRILRGDGKGEIWVAEVKSRFGRLSAKKSAGRVIENSVGKRRKGPASKQKDSEAGEGPENRGLAETEQSEEQSGVADDTDIQPFIDSFQRRGLMLKEGSIDKTNKMFVTMIFTKTGIPRAGKWKGMKWDGKQYRKIEDPKFTQHKKFGTAPRMGAAEEINEQDEGKLLKPCVYKQR